MNRLLIGLAATLLLLLSVPVSATDDGEATSVGELRAVYETSEVGEENVASYIRGLAEMWLISSLQKWAGDEDMRRYVGRCVSQYTPRLLTHAVMGIPGPDTNWVAHTVYNILNQCVGELEESALIDANLQRYMKSRNPQLETGSEDSK